LRGGAPVLHTKTLVEKFIESIGRLFALLPEWAVRALCRILGGIVFHLTSRRAVYLRNLSHAFPNQSEAWRRRMARECSYQDFELFFLSVAAPWMSDAEILDRIRMTDAHRERLAALIESGTGVVALIPHVTMIESLTVLPLIDKRFAKIGTMYRPLDYKPADAVVRRARSRFGAELFPAKEAVYMVRDFLRDGGLVGFLWDQHAGRSGALTLLFDRVCTTTDLHGLFARNGRAKVIFLYPRRTGFWRAELEVEPYEGPYSQSAITVASNAWLEKKLRDNPDAIPGWLWGHKRWKWTELPERRLNLEHKKNYLAETLAHLGKENFPKSERFWLRLPDDPEGARAALRLIPALRRGRPDGEFRVFVAPDFHEEAVAAGLADAVVAVPLTRGERHRLFRHLRSDYPDTWILFSEDAAADRDAALTRCRLIFGIRRDGGPRRPRLSHAWNAGSASAPSDVAARRAEWEAMLRHFGLPEHALAPTEE